MTRVVSITSLWLLSAAFSVAIVSHASADCGWNPRVPELSGYPCEKERAAEQERQRREQERQRAAEQDRQREVERKATFDALRSGCRPGVYRCPP